MKPYLDLLSDILANGKESSDRTGTGTLSIFGYQNRYDLKKGFPLLTTKKLHIRSIIYELLWFLKGDTNVRYLQENKVKIWDDWADKEGDLGPVYGAQWRSWATPDGKTIDQIKNLIKGLKENPSSRRHIVTAWNPADIGSMKLPPCHCLFQFYLRENTLSCQLYQRSADAFLGVPFNIASYSLLTHMVAHVLGVEVGGFIHTFGDVHLYKNHIEQAKIQLGRTPHETLPTLRFNEKRISIFDFEYSDIIIENYTAEPHIKAEVAV